MDQAGFFKGDTMMEVFTVLANSGTDVKTVRDTVILYIARKKQKGRSEQHIQDKLSQLEDKFKHIEAWHPAFRDARALFQLPKSKHIPLPKSIIRKKRESELLSPILDIGPAIPSPPQSPSFSSPTPSSWDGPTGITGHAIRIAYILLGRRETWISCACSYIASWANDFV